MEEELKKIGRKLKEFSTKYGKESVDVFIAKGSVHGFVYDEKTQKTELRIWISSEEISDEN